MARFCDRRAQGRLPRQRAIGEINSGVYAFDLKRVFEAPPSGLVLPRVMLSS